MLDMQDYLDVFHTETDFAFPAYCYLSVRLVRSRKVSNSEAL